MAIIVAAVIAVIKLILAGAQYVLSGVVTDKANAKKDIRSALVGLLIILAAITLLTTINPNITNLPDLKPLDADIAKSMSELIDRTGTKTNPGFEYGAEYVCNRLGNDCVKGSCGVGDWMKPLVHVDWQAVYLNCSDACEMLGGYYYEDGGASHSCVYSANTYRETTKESLLKKYCEPGYECRITYCEEKTDNTIYRDDVTNTCILPPSVAANDTVVEEKCFRETTLGIFHEGEGTAFNRCMEECSERKDSTYVHAGNDAEENLMGTCSYKKELTMDEIIARDNQ